MPRLSAKTKSNRNKLRDSFGRMVSSNEGNATSNNLEDWQVWEEDGRDLLVQAERNSSSAVELQTLDVNTILKDDGMTGTRKRGGFYSKTSRTTKWRKSVEAKKVDPKNTLFQYMYTNQQEQEKQEPPLPHTQQEVVLKCIQFYC
jgi:hypothetical protein